MILHYCNDSTVYFQLQFKVSDYCQFYPSKYKQIFNYEQSLVINVLLYAIISLIIIIIIIQVRSTYVVMENTIFGRCFKRRRYVTVIAFSCRKSKKKKNELYWI